MLFFHQIHEIVFELLSFCQFGKVYIKSRLVPYHALLTGLLQPRNRECFKQRGEAAGRLGPGQSHDSRTVLGTAVARRPGVQDRAVLAGVEVTPAAFRLMVVKRALGAALRTKPMQLFIVFEEDVIVQKLTKRGVRIEFVKENLTFRGEDSPLANLMLSVMGAFAEFEWAFAL